MKRKNKGYRYGGIYGGAIDECRTGAMKLAIRKGNPRLFYEYMKEILRSVNFYGIAKNRKRLRRPIL